MAKVKDISPKMSLLPSSEELLIPPGTDLMGQRVGGLSMFSDVFKRGYGANTYGNDSNGSWWGGADYNTGVAKVDYSGNATFTSISLTGYVADGEAAADINTNIVTVDGGKITAGSVTASQISANTITSSQIASNTITSSQIAANTITATEMSVSQLSAIAADMGTITAGTVTGATIRTASSGARFEISGSKAGSYNSSNVELTRLDGSGLGLYGTGGNVIKFKNTAAGTTYGEEGYSSGLGMYLTSTGNVDMVVNADKELYLLGDVDVNIDALSDVYINAGASKNVFIDDIRTNAINMNYGGSEGSISNLDSLNGYNDLKLYGNGEIYLDPSSAKVKFAKNIDLNEQDLDAGNTLWAYSFSSRSDRRLKKNINSLGDSLENILQLNPVEFDWKKDGKHSYGLIAQEVYKIMPGVVKKSDDGYLSIDYVSIVPFLVKAVQELYEAFGTPIERVAQTPEDGIAFFERTVEEKKVEADRKDKSRYVNKRVIEAEEEKENRLKSENDVIEKMSRIRIMNEKLKQKRTAELKK